MSAQPEDLIWSDAEADHDLEAWSPLDLSLPEKMLRQLSSLNRRIAHIQSQATEMREPIDRWEREQMEPLKSRAAVLEQGLQEIARRYREADEKRNKTLVLPSGRVESTARQPRITVTDETKVVRFMQDFANERNEPVENYLRIKAEPKMDQLKRLAQIVEAPAGLVAAAYGEPIPGVEVIPGDVSYRVKPGGGK